MAVEVAQREARELLVDLVAQPVDDALGHVDGQVLLQPLEDGAEQVHEGEQQQHPADDREVGSDAGRQRHRRDHLGLLLGTGLPAGRELGDRVGLSLAGRHLLRSTTPWNSTLVTLPRIFGPATLNPTLKTASRMMSAMVSA